MLSSNESLNMTDNNSYDEYVLCQSVDNSPTFPTMEDYYSPYSEALAYQGPTEMYYNDQQYSPTNMLSDDPHSYQQSSEPNFRQTFYDPFDVKHRKRTSRAQFKVLEKTFMESPKPNATVRRWLAQRLSMTPRGVQVWFQNRRAKEKSVKKIKIEEVDVDEKLSSNLFNDVTFQSDSVSHAQRAYGCHDCHHFATPMSRTLSYPPVYSDASTNADDEELLPRTPATPLIDGIHKSAEWDITPNPNYFYDTHCGYMNYQNIRKIESPINCRKDTTMFNRSLLQEDLMQSSNMQRIYGNNMIMNDHRRLSYPINPVHKYFHSTELFRRLSDPIFDHDINFNSIPMEQYEFPRKTTQF